MTLKFLVLAAVNVAAGLVIPVAAQDLTYPLKSEPANKPADGIRIAEASNGFQLFEHGLWQAVQRATASNPDYSDTRGANIPPYRQPAPGTGTLSFRRAIYLSHVYAAEAKYALPMGLLDALVWTESRYNPLAVSKAGAAGLGQLMPATARELGVSDRFDPVANIDGAARYLRQMLDRFGLVHLALAAYNAGPGAVAKAGGIPRNGETPAYVRNVLRQWKL